MSPLGKLGARMNTGANSFLRFGTHCRAAAAGSAPSPPRQWRRFANHRSANREEAASALKLFELLMKLEFERHLSGWFAAPAQPADAGRRVVASGGQQTDLAKTSDLSELRVP